MADLETQIPDPEGSIQDENTHPAPEKSPAPSQADADKDLFEQFLEASDDLYLPERGDLREGIIVERRPSEILVNIGIKRDGVVPQSDLARLDPEFVATLVEGHKVDVLVSRSAEDDDSILLLSISEAFQRKDWLLAEQLLESGEVTLRKVIAYNKGGMLVDFGHLRGFIPASHLVNLPRNLNEDQRRIEMEKRIGQELPVKVIEVARRRRRLVLSHQLAEREYRANRKEELFSRLKVGDVVEGVVRSMRPFGAFVDIGGADGLLHVSEIGWASVGHPRDVLNVGDTIKVEILSLDAERNRIALSRKRLLANPWDSVETRYISGGIVKATITRVVDFGAFAELEPGVEGLIHISELADITVAEPLKTVRTGDVTPVKILRVDPRRQRIGLSRRQALGTVEAAEILGSEQAPAVQESAEAEVVTDEAPLAVESQPDEPVTAVEAEAGEVAAEDAGEERAPEASPDTPEDQPGEEAPGAGAG